LDIFASLILAPLFPSSTETQNVHFNSFFCGLHCTFTSLPVLIVSLLSLHVRPSNIHFLSFIVKFIFFADISVRKHKSIDFDCFPIHRHLIRFERDILARRSLCSLFNAFLLLLAKLIVKRTSIYIIYILCSSLEESNFTLDRL
jgi:hypothetical protein